MLNQILRMVPKCFVYMLTTHFSATRKLIVLIMRLSFKNYCWRKNHFVRFIFSSVFPIYFINTFSGFQSCTKVIPFFNRQEGHYIPFESFDFITGLKGNYRVRHWIICTIVFEACKQQKIQSILYKPTLLLTHLSVG